MSAKSQGFQGSRPQRTYQLMAKFFLLPASIFDLWSSSRYFNSFNSRLRINNRDTAVSRRTPSRFHNRDSAVSQWTHPRFHNRDTRFHNRLRGFTMDSYAVSQSRLCSFTLEFLESFEVSQQRLRGLTMDSEISRWTSTQFHN